MMLVFQLLPSTAEELEGAADAPRPVEIKELVQFMETEPLALGVEEVSGNLSRFHVSSVANRDVAITHTGGRLQCSQSGLTSFQVHCMALLRLLERPSGTCCRADQGHLLRSTYGRHYSSCYSSSGQQKTSAVAFAVAS